VVQYVSSSCMFVMGAIQSLSETHRLTAYGAIADSDQFYLSVGCWPKIISHFHAAGVRCGHFSAAG
jgi:hypothetical protein